MNIDDIMGNKDFQSIMKSVRQIAKGKEFSDIVDNQGHQYVDLVMEGGGMLGIALVGYTYALEQAGIRFLGIGGTSAGSINAILLAALGKPAEAKGDKLLKELFTKNFIDFVDGDSDARDFIKSWIDGDGNIKLAFKAMQVIDNIRDDMGLNPGKTFTKWIRDILDREGIASWKDLKAQLETIPEGLRTRKGELLDTPEKAGCRLGIIAADVSTETKVEFPKMAELYWNDPLTVDPALFVRASMSIPFFFTPMKLKSLPKGDVMFSKWNDLAGFNTADEGGVPKTAMFIDGGVMSNFPIDLFHDPINVPTAPTFGVKLELDYRRKKVDSPFGLLGAIFNSARHTLDYDFIHRNPDYKKLVTWIPAKGYNWLDFNMPPKDKLGLFLEGASCAEAFLRKFNWEEYKDIRRKLLAGG